jgi:23S rRNA (cytosine1962-C5)-methyltransferase
MPSPDPLGRLPAPAERRLAVRVTPDALRQVRSGHPWVFDDSVTSVSRTGAPGDLAVVFDDRRRFAAIGLWDPGSPIRVRILQHGAPRPVDAGLWDERVRTALARRAELLARSDADAAAFRLVHGENDQLPGLVVDRYADVLVVKVYTAAWLPHLRPVVEALQRIAPCAGVVLRLGRTVRDEAGAVGLADGDVIAGRVPAGPVRFREGGLWFDADVRAGQKTGHFLDQRANRHLVGSEATGRTVFDVFAATGGFSVHAAAGGARAVHSVDRSRPTLAMASHNMALNDALEAVRRCRHTVEAGDAFDVLARMARDGRRFDVAVVDPPSFTRRAADVPAAERADARLTRLALAVVRPGGRLVQASCSSRVDADRFFDVVETAAASAGRPLRTVRKTFHDVDHPVAFPQGAYLKAGFWDT